MKTGSTATIPFQWIFALFITLTFSLIPSARAQVDLDPTYDGPELYTGGKKGNLYQIVAHRECGFDARIARFPAEEIHTIIGGELLNSSKGNELLIFTLLGAVYRIDIDPQQPQRFHSTKIDTLAGRVREAILLPIDKDNDPWFAAACRQGELLLLKMKQDGLEKQVIAREPMGLGRVARIDLFGAPGPARNRGGAI